MTHALSESLHYPPDIERVQHTQDPRACEWGSHDRPTEAELPANSAFQPTGAICQNTRGCTSAAAALGGAKPAGRRRHRCRCRGRALLLVSVATNVLCGLHIDATISKSSICKITICKKNAKFAICIGISELSNRSMLSNLQIAKCPQDPAAWPRGSGLMTTMTCCSRCDDKLAFPQTLDCVLTCHSAHPGQLLPARTGGADR